LWNIEEYFTYGPSYRLHDIVLMPVDELALQKLYLLKQFPFLSTAASKRTGASKLDGRTCRYIYLSEWHLLDFSKISAEEAELMRSLGLIGVTLATTAPVCFDTLRLAPPKSTR
jgi:hypothetical protein